ncbi:hypothetical protein [Leptospira ilyithenensis]|uniref:Lipoprotein n=1 Tax=Leptospira ilyithenensis TaxID=2484901 RepID=A0A4R9LX39_9LEPT|nr:hypothetical protein [Leptospira ilyithenensis]TGN14279.1 hypothetical protein EHS11_02030 [Leptospira ilyithenensis]
MKLKLPIIGMLLFAFVSCGSGDPSDESPLNGLEMQGNQLLQNILLPAGICTENCMLGFERGAASEMVYDVKKFYNSGGKNTETAEPRNRDWWVYEKFPHKVIGVTLKINPTCAAFSVKYSDKFRVESHCGGDRIMLIEFGMNSVTHTISENAKKIAIGWDILPGVEASMQVVQLDSRGQSLKSSIIYDDIYGTGLKDQKQNDQPIIRIQNLANTVVPNHSSEYLKKLEITGVTFSVREDITGDRPPRSLEEFACSNPLLAFFDFLFVKACEKAGNIRPAHNIDQYVPNTGNPVYVSGSYPSPVQVDEDKVEQNPSDEFLLKRVVSSENVNLAAAVTTTFNCRVPYREVIAHRRTRGVDEESAVRRCIRTSLDVVTPFVQLFWGRISTMFADRTTINDMVQNILGGHGTGQPSSSSQTETENQLIFAVQELTRISGDGGREAQRLLLSAIQVGSYWEVVESQGDSEEQRNDVRDEFIQKIDTNFASAKSQDLYIGEYELNMSTLTNWVRPEQIPQVWSGNQFRNSPERFTSEILYSRDFRPGYGRSPFLNDFRAILRDWDTQFITAAGIGGLSSAKKSYYFSASWLAGLFREWTDPFDSNKNLILIVVYFKNRPVSLLLGSIDSSGKVAELQLSLSSPYDVVEEYRQEGFSIRGGGTQNILLYFEEMKKKGVVLVMSNVVSQASARMKLRWGFRPAFVPYTTMSPSPPSPLR